MLCTDLSVSSLLYRHSLRRNGVNPVWVLRILQHIHRAEYWTPAAWSYVGYRFHPYDSPFSVLDNA